MKLLLSPFTEEKIEVQRILLPVRGWKAAENMEAAEGGQLWVLVKTVESTFQSRPASPLFLVRDCIQESTLECWALEPRQEHYEPRAPSCQKFSRVLNRLYLIWTLL